MTTLVGNQVTLVDKSGTITAGGSAQTAIASNSLRRGFIIQNNSSGNLWFSSMATAVQSQPSFLIQPGGYYETPVHAVPTATVSIIGPTTGQAFTAREW